MEGFLPNTISYVVTSQLGVSQMPSRAHATVQSFSKICAPQGDQAVLYVLARNFCKCNSLQTWFPDIAEEWDYARNKGTADDYPAQSTKAAWWKSIERGSWQTPIQGRTQCQMKYQKYKAAKQQLLFIAVGFVTLIVKYC